MKKPFPMLAGKADLAKLRYPLLASAKIDGVRAMVHEGALLSRALKTFPNPHVNELFANEALNGFDGELVVGRPHDQQLRNKTAGAMNRHTGEPDVSFHVFDLHNAPLHPFAERLEMLEEHVAARKLARVVVVPHILVDNERQLLKYEEFKLDEGYEGLILRDPAGPYKHGRSTTNEGWMLKLKRFEDAEAMVLEVLEEEANHNPAEKDNFGRTKRSGAQAGKVGKGRAGALRAVGVNGRFDGVEFEIPLSVAGDEGKSWWWTVGRDMVDDGLVVTYRYFPKGVKDKPLLTTYVGIREDWDGEA